MDTQEEETHDIARSIASDGSSQAVQPTHATPIRHLGASSAAVNSSKCSPISDIEYVFRSGTEGGGAQRFRPHQVCSPDKWEWMG